MFDGRFRHAVDRSTIPVGRALVRAGVSADVLTGFGLAMSVVSALVVGTGHLVWGIVLLFATGLPDLFDGPVAKASGTASVRGAFFDSVADRISDGFLYGGVAWYLAARNHGELCLLPFAILAVTSLISYQRAKAELLGIEARGGLMERAERFILLGACYLAGSISASAFIPALWVFLALVVGTASGRFVRVWRAAGAAPRQVSAARALSSGAEDAWHELGWRSRRGRVDSRWRVWREARSERARGVGAHAGSRLVPGARRAGEPLARWRSRRAAVPGSRVLRIGGRQRSETVRGVARGLGLGRGRGVRHRPR